MGQTEQPNLIHAATDALMRAARGSDDPDIPFGGVIVIKGIEYVLVQRANIELLLGVINEKGAATSVKPIRPGILRPSELMPNLHPEQR